VQWPAFGQIITTSHHVNDVILLVCIRLIHESQIEEMQVEEFLSL
jgi:hypothetical protein